MEFIALYVQTSEESAARIDLSSQRHLINHLRLVTELGGKIVQVQLNNVLGIIYDVCKKRQISMICMGVPDLRCQSCSGKYSVIKNSCILLLDQI